MIVAIEGPSAVGKTTWCRTQAPRFVKEAPPGLDAPDLFADPIDVANF
jgi:uridine kinase